MILLDTNIVSETMKAAPTPQVIRWLDAQAAETLFLSTVSLAELLLGIALLPTGRKKRDLAISLAERALGMFGPRLLSFDRHAAQAFAEIVGHARKKGRSIGFADGQIAAIASIHRCTIATRDTEPFESAGLAVINPWVP